MRSIALLSLFHDRTKLVAAVAGVSFAALLVLVQLGMYAGFLDTSSSVIARVGGDVWVMARGTQVLDLAEPISAGSHAIAVEHACVARARPLIYELSAIRKSTGTRDFVRVIGTDKDAAHLMPWDVSAGLPSDLDAPMTIGIDGLDAKKLQIEGPLLGAKLQVNNERTTVVTISHGARSFTLMPFAFASVATARRLTNMEDGAVNYWVLDLKDPACAPEVMARIAKNPELQARTRDQFLADTQDYWVIGSGAGAALGFSALLGLTVGIVIVGQTLYSMTKDYHRELATLKAIGGTNRELMGFVAWQAAFLAVVGATIGTIGAFTIKRLADHSGMTIILSAGVLRVSIGAVFAMCAGASLMSVRQVIKLEAAEVFK